MSANKEDISVIGLGKLGLCFALTLERAGYRVLGVDISAEHVEAINNRAVTSDEPGVSDGLKRSRNITATMELKRAVGVCDFLYVIVATPSLDDGGYDHSQVDGLVDGLIQLGAQETTRHLVICCTTMPGYCDSVQERLGRYNYQVSYNPEFIAQGTILRDQRAPDIVLIGEASRGAGDGIQRHHEDLTDNSPTFCRMTRTEAEICKISLNCFLTTKISFANMIGDICVRSGADPGVVLRAIGADSRVSPGCLGFGYGYGGPCFPRDNRALARYSRSRGVEAHISVASDEMNQAHARYLFEDYVRKNPDRSEPVTFESVTYKPESTMLEESQQLRFAEMLARAGYKVVISERAGVIGELKERYKDLFVYKVR